MCLSCTISDTFSVEYWRDLEILVRDRSKSLKMVPFESFGTISYSRSIATTVVSLAVSTQYTNVTDPQPPSRHRTARAALVASLGCIARQKLWRCCVCVCSCQLWSRLALRVESTMNRENRRLLTKNVTANELLDITGKALLIGIDTRVYLADESGCINMLTHLWRPMQISLTWWNPARTGRPHVDDATSLLT